MALCVLCAFVVLFVLVCVVCGGMVCVVCGGVVCVVVLVVFWRMYKYSGNVVY